jgi:hypothetical protein
VKVLSTAGEPLGGPFASVEIDFSTVTLKVMYSHWGTKKTAQIEMSDEAFEVLATAMIQAMRLPSDCP